MYCSNCKQQLTDTARFCSFCGADVSAQAQAGPPPDPRPQPYIQPRQSAPAHTTPATAIYKYKHKYRNRKRAPLFIGILAAAVCLVLVFTLVVYPKFSRSEQTDYYYFHAGLFTSDWKTYIRQDGSVAFTLGDGFLGFAFDSETGLAMVVNEETEKCGYLKTDGSFAVAPIYHIALPYEANGLARVQMEEGGPVVVIDRDGNVVIDGGYEAIGQFTDGIARVLKDGLYGFIDTRGKVVIEPQYEGAWSFVSGMAKVKGTDEDAMEYGIIDTDGDLLVSWDGEEYSGPLKKVFQAVPLGLDSIDYCYRLDSGYLVIIDMQSAQCYIFDSRNRLVYEGDGISVRTWPGEGELIVHAYHPNQNTFYRILEKEGDRLVGSGAEVLDYLGGAGDQWLYEDSGGWHLFDGKKEIPLPYGYTPVYMPDSSGLIPAKKGDSYCFITLDGQVAAEIGDNINWASFNANLVAAAGDVFFPSPYEY